MNKNLKKISKTLSYLLRHKPQNFGIKLEKKGGWAYTNEVLDAVKITLDELQQIVDDNDKNRFKFNEDKSKIRASQGHSLTLGIEIDMEKVVPPFKLYHGTKKDVLDIIMKEGLKPITRLVHLSPDIETATAVSDRRKGDNVILEIEARAMYTDGVDIRLSENGVYIVEYVDPKYIYVK